MYIDQRFLVAGSVTIGIGLGVIGIGNAAILDKINDEKDADKIEKLRKDQRLINYIGGGIGVLGCILCLTSVKRDFSGGYAITKRLSFKDKKRGLALTYRF